MRTINSYLDECKAKLGFESDYQLQKHLGLGRGIITNWRSGKRGLDDYNAMRLGELIGRDPLEMIAATNAERETDPVKKSAWENWAKKLQGIAAACVFSVLPLTLISQDAKATSALPQISHTQQPLKNTNQIPAKHTSTMPHFILC